MPERVQEIMAVWEFRGEYPEVQIAEGVDYGELTEGDDAPVFVTLPIGKANVLSANKRFYDDAFLQELERQVVANRPVGLMGHLRAEDRATEFPAEAVHWVGARRDGDLLWGKGYVPPGEARQRLRRYKASGKKIATSIDALVEGIWDESVGGMRVKAQGMRLGQIDIAPADRAGIADLAAVPLLTKEMAGDAQPEQAQKEQDVNREQVIREMTAADVALLPDAVRQAVLGQAAPAPETATVAALREALGLDAKADVVDAVQEMRRTQAEQQKAAVAARIKELAADPDKGVKIAPVRELVVELVTARNPTTVQEAEATYAAVVASEPVKQALALQVRETLGPKLGTPVQGQGDAAKYFVIPADA